MLLPRQGTLIAAPPRSLPGLPLAPGCGSPWFIPCFPTGPVPGSQLRLEAVQLCSGSLGAQHQLLLPSLSIWRVAVLAELGGDIAL